MNSSPSIFHNAWVFKIFLLILTYPPTSDQLSYTRIDLNFKQGHLDTWTETNTGCGCLEDPDSTDCACCAQGGCLCSGESKHRCVQCGLQASCGNVCNVTISSAQIKQRSGRSTGELKSSSDLKGPTFCWYRFEPSADERVEIHLYRLLRIGEYHAVNQRCMGGGVSFITTSLDQLNSSSHQLVCGLNERYSPPLVLFKEADETGVPTLIVQIDQQTERSQFLAHFSFTRLGDPINGLQIRGGQKVENTECDWLFKSCDRQTSCQLASPGFPGIYTQKTECKYTLQPPNNGNYTYDIELRKISFPRSAGSCESTYLGLYEGNKKLHHICRDQDGIKYQISSAKKIHLVFKSGAVIPPFIDNGFLALVSFSQIIPVTKPSTVKPYRTSPKPKRFFIPDSSRDLGLPTHGCNAEVQGGQVRAGTVKSTPGFIMNKCSIVFRGAERDIVLIKLNKIKFRQSGCESGSFRISIQDPAAQYGVRTVTEICDSMLETNSYPLVVNSSLVFLDFNTDSQATDSFIAQFIFMNVLSDGYPRPNTICDIQIRGNAFPFLPKLQGQLSTPTEVNVFNSFQKPVSCEYSLENGVNQSVILTISGMKPSKSSPHCLTGCDGTGCQCITRSSLSLVDHLLVKSLKNGIIGCFCGNYQKLLPKVYRSSDILSVNYYHPTANSSHYKFDDRMKFNGQYKFMTSGRVACGWTLFNSSSGKVERPLLIKGDLPWHEDCTYRIEPAPHRILKLEISALGAAKVGCLDWELLIWSEQRLLNNSLGATAHKRESYSSIYKDFNQNTILRKENIGRMCGGEVHRSFSVYDMFNKVVNIRVSSLYPTRPGYSIAWQSDGPIPNHIINTKNKKDSEMLRKISLHQDLDPSLQQTSPASRISTWIKYTHYFTIFILISAIIQ